MKTIEEVRKLTSEYKKKYPNFNKFINWNESVLREWEFNLLRDINAIKGEYATEDYTPYMLMLIEDAKQLAKENTFKKYNTPKLEDLL